MSEKTALEFVDELIAMMGCPPPGQLIKLKSAIKRERDASEITIDGLEELVKSNTRTIQDMNDRLKSAITMRPIAELPDSVPDGCVIVAVGKLRVTIKCWVWEPGDDVFPHEGETHFYILPLPKPARRLHPCYFPWCKGEVAAKHHTYCWRIVCSKCGMLGPTFDTQEAAEKEWGTAE